VSYYKNVDSITHTLAGGVIAKAIGDEKIGNWGTIAGLSMGLFPDLDFVLGLFNRHFYLEYHRDFTHSLLLIPLYGLFFSWVFVKISRRPHFWSFYKLCVPVLVSHILLDLLTSYGTMIFSPFFEHRYSWDLIFIVDFIFSGILFIPFLGSLLLKKKAQWISRGAIVGLAVYVLFCWVQHEKAIDLAKNFTVNLDEGILRVASLPQPLSPFRWANYAETKDKVYQGFVDLRRKQITKLVSPETRPFHDTSVLGRWRRMSRLYQPPEKMEYDSWQKFDDSPWVKKALDTEGVKFFYWFARFPVVQSVNFREGRHRVEFMDLRFFFPDIQMPFVYYVEFDDSGKVQSEGFVENRIR
jgi:inner membrane protein